MPTPSSPFLSSIAPQGQASSSEAQSPMDATRVALEEQVSAYRAELPQDMHEQIAWLSETLGFPLERALYKKPRSWTDRDVDDDEEDLREEDTDDLWEGVVDWDEESASRYDSEHIKVMIQTAMGNWMAVSHAPASHHPKAWKAWLTALSLAQTFEQWKSERGEDLVFEPIEPMQSVSAVSGLPNLNSLPDLWRQYWVMREKKGWQSSTSAKGKSNQAHVPGGSGLPSSSDSWASVGLPVVTSLTVDDEVTLLRHHRWCWDAITQACGLTHWDGATWVGERWFPVVGKVFPEALEEHVIADIIRQFDKHHDPVAMAQRAESPPSALARLLRVQEDASYLFQVQHPIAKTFITRLWQGLIEEADRRLAQGETLKRLSISATMEELLGRCHQEKGGRGAAVTMPYMVLLHNWTKHHDMTRSDDVEFLLNMTRVTLPSQKLIWVDSAEPSMLNEDALIQRDGPSFQDVLPELSPALWDVAWRMAWGVTHREHWKQGLRKAFASDNKEEKEDIQSMLEATQETMAMTWLEHYPKGHPPRFSLALLWACSKIDLNDRKSRAWLETWCESRGHTVEALRSAMPYEFMWVQKKAFSWWQPSFAQDPESGPRFADFLACDRKSTYYWEGSVWREEDEPLPARIRCWDAMLDAWSKLTEEGWPSRWQEMRYVEGGNALRQSFGQGEMERLETTAHLRPKMMDNQQARPKGWLIWARHTMARAKKEEAELAKEACHVSPSVLRWFAMYVEAHADVFDPSLHDFARYADERHLKDAWEPPPVSSVRGRTHRF